MTSAAELNDKHRMSGSSTATWRCMACVAVQEKYVHRDITSGNVLLKDGGCACLADFGLAHQLPTPESTVIGSAMQADHILMGTFGYMAPEYTVNSGAALRLSAEAMYVSPKRRHTLA